VFNVCINIWLIFLYRFVGLFSKLFAKKIFGRFAQSYLVNFKELLPFQTLALLKPFPKDFHLLQMKRPTIRPEPLCLVKNFFYLFLFFSKKVFSRNFLPKLKKLTFQIWKDLPLSRLTSRLSTLFFIFFEKNFKKVKSLSKNDFQIADRIPFWKLWFSSCIIFFQLQALFLKKFYIIY